MKKWKDVLNAFWHSPEPPPVRSSPASTDPYASAARILESSGAQSPSATRPVGKSPLLAMSYHPEPDRQAMIWFRQMDHNKRMELLALLLKVNLEMNQSDRFSCRSSRTPSHGRTPGN